MVMEVNQIVQRGHTVTFNIDGVTVKNPEEQVIATGSRVNGLFKLNQLSSSRKALACSSVATDGVAQKDGPYQFQQSAASRRISVYFLIEKSAESVFKAFEYFRRSAERQTGKKLKVLRTDNGKEFFNKLLGDHLKRLGIRHQTSVDYTPEQNGLAERANRTIVERARCMLFDAKLPKSFWAEAAATVVYLVNRSPTKGHGQTPEEIWSGKKPSLAHVRVFGSPVMAHIPKPKRKKWDAKAHECILTGFEEDAKAYRLWDPLAKQIIKRRDLDLDGELPWKPISCERAPTAQGGIDNSEVVLSDEDKSDSVYGDTVDPDYDDNALRRSGRERFLTDKLKDLFFMSTGLPSDRFSDGADNNVASSATEDPEAETSGLQQGLVITNRSKHTGDPRTPYEAINSQHGDQWKAAMDEEFNWKRYLGTGRAAAEPESHWIRFRMLVKHVDVKKVGKLEEPIYMKQPEGYTTGNSDTVCLLKKSLYGLKQSARVWNQRIDDVFRRMGFVASIADSCLYVRRRTSATCVLLYVDDMLIVTETADEFAAIFRQLQKNFEVANLGDVKHFLGIEIERDSAYLQQKEEENRLPSNTQYLSLIGGLLYVAVHSRPDIAVSTSILAQKSSYPTQLDQEAKRVLRYLKATCDHKLHLGSQSTGLELFADADWAGNYRDRKSNTGFLIRFGGGVTSWASRKQSCVALSFTEAEFVSLAEACQELTWVKKLLTDFGVDVSEPVPTFEDNQSCIKLINSDRIEKRSKHIETKYFYVRDLQEKKQILLKYCPTEEMLAWSRSGVVAYCRS
ncbi:uncharacterized protein LOC129773324 [Toxorhynchites rutilus septentrionalis]|uniref:uncharacterized protein LOC129773324 n=1 Tax=Toxorhynchites rutilus septentrionalis TaxID=329112 RepID=UPI00247AC6CC|nr:uncharacterized protein LOC129773324 [Toxorhynchites rutilus septentrionalis]